jgi:diguanylate cyclase (GGDEF)-like protein
MKILLVEDEPNVLMALEELLTAAQHTIVTAQNGEQGIELFLNEQPDLVLLDVNLPGLDGYQVAQNIRSKTDGEWVPIIFLSGEGSDEAIARGIEVGGDDYLVKPISYTVLSAKLRAMERIAATRRDLDRVSKQLTEANKHLEWLSFHDALTNVANRRFFDSVLTQEWNRQRRLGKPLSLLLIDIDDFKAYNDFYGHQHGDQCLSKIAHLLQQRVQRSSDLLCRYGGEEFAVILPMLTHEEAYQLAERLRLDVAGACLEHCASSTVGYVTVSIGVASTIPSASSTTTDLIANADKKLYQAKSCGKNQVIDKAS